MDIHSSHTRRNKKLLPIVVVAAVVIGWFVASELATAWWFGLNEAKLPRNPVPVEGSAVVARLKAIADEQSASVKVEEVAAAAMEMLKCSFGETVSWNSGYSFSAVSVLRWDDRSTVSGTETMHNPGNCLRGAGWNILGSADLGVMRFHDTTAEVTEWDVEQGGTQMKAFIAVFRRFAVEDTDDREPRRYWNAARLDPVFDGRRDAPLMIMLAYLPPQFGETPERTRDRFKAIMQAALDEQAKSQGEG